MNKLLVTTLLVLFSAGAAADDLKTRMKSLEDGYELNASALRLPGTPVGNLDIKACNECQSRSMQIDENSRFFIGNTQVAISELRGFLDSHPDKSVLVVTAAGKNVVLRISIAGNVQR